MSTDESVRADRESKSRILCIYIGGSRQAYKLDELAFAHASKRKGTGAQGVPEWSKSMHGPMGSRKNSCKSSMTSLMEGHLRRRGLNSDHGRLKIGRLDKLRWVRGQPAQSRLVARRLPYHVEDALFIKGI